MDTLKKVIQRNVVMVFIVGTYLVSWTIWLPFVLFGTGTIKALGSFGPTIAALMIVGLTKGRKGLKELLARILIWKVPLFWYLFSFFSTLIVILLSLGIYRLAGNEVVATNDPSQWYLIVVIFLYVLFFSVAGEEIGWRGFLLPRLQQKYTALTASLIIGLIWGFWHLPLFLIPGDFHVRIPFLLFVLQDVALSVLLTWLYNNTRKSLLLVHLFHAASNTTIGLLPILPSESSDSLVPLYLSVAILVLFAIFIVFRYGPATLTKSWTRQDSSSSG
jgi:membrane protease YdiL (CAAX protease family)